MKRIKNFKSFSEHKKVDESLGLLIGGAILSIPFLIGLGKVAKNKINKWIVKSKFEKTGEEELIDCTDPKFKSYRKSMLFEKLIEKSTGKTYWGVEVTKKYDHSGKEKGIIGGAGSNIELETSPIEDHLYENEEYLIFDEVGYENAKKLLSEGNMNLTGEVDSYSVNLGRVRNENKDKKINELNQIDNNKLESLLDMLRLEIKDERLYQDIERVISMHRIDPYATYKQIEDYLRVKFPMINDLI